MQSLFLRYPALVTISLAAAFVLLDAIGVLILLAATPGLDELYQRLILVLVNTVLVLALTAALGWWRQAGFVGVSRWRNVKLLWLPFVLVLLPLVAGVHAPDAATFLALVVGYLATGVFEETLFRGLALYALLPQGVYRAVAISSIVFGFSHVERLFHGSPPILVAWQVLGAVCFGVGVAALRLRTGTIWPLILFHMLQDLFLQLGNLPPALVNPIQAIVLLVYGIVLLRGHRQEIARYEHVSAQGARLDAASPSPRQ